MMRKLVTAGVLSALGVVISPLLSFPILAFKVYPGQHMINAISGVLLGPWWVPSYP
jgi:energy coupling factor transporter S component ThiW